MSDEFDRIVEDAPEPICELGTDFAFPELSPREREVALALAAGWTCRYIASSLGISVKTVDTHRQNLLKKLDLPNNVRLCRLAIRRGYLIP